MEFDLSQPVHVLTGDAFEEAIQMLIQEEAERFVDDLSSDELNRLRHYSSRSIAELLKPSVN